MASKQYSSIDGWGFAHTLLIKYLKAPSKIDSLLNDLPEDISSNIKRSCQFLFFGTIRHKRFLEHALLCFIKKKPKLPIWSLLLLASFEIFASDASKLPKIVDFAVSKAKKVSKYDSSLVNAVLRKIPAALAESHSPAITYSHPDWLVDHWMAQFGPENTLALLQWNQSIPKNYLRSHSSQPLLNPSPWPNFYEITNWDVAKSLLNSPNTYIQDPSTRIAPSLPPINPSDAILDLAAAPGGKSLQLAEKLGSQGLLVSVDLPSARIQYLYENLSKINDCNYKIIESDILKLSSELFSSLNLPSSYNTVLLDAPCSNTGVIQRRPDVKWRLSSEDIYNVSKIQLQLLLKASEFVAPGGFLVYSTCSIEAIENQSVIDEFIQSHPHFTLLKSYISLPWETQHDGCGAFLLQKCY